MTGQEVGSVKENPGLTSSSVECRRARVYARSLTCQVEVDCALFVASPVANIGDTHNGCFVDLTLDGQAKFVDLGAVNLGSSVLNPNPMGKYWEKSGLAPGEGGVKGNGLVMPQFPATPTNGLAKPGEPQVAVAPAVVSAKGEFGAEFGEPASRGAAVVREPDAAVHAEVSRASRTPGKAHARSTPIVLDGHAAVLVDALVARPNKTNRSRWEHRGLLTGPEGSQ